MESTIIIVNMINVKRLKRYRLWYMTLTDFRKTRAVHSFKIEHSFGDAMVDCTGRRK